MWPGAKIQKLKSILNILSCIEAKKKNSGKMRWAASETNIAMGASSFCF
jgi:hypothetical protein